MKEEVEIKEGIAVDKNRWIVPLACLVVAVVISAAPVLNFADDDDEIDEEECNLSAEVRYQLRNRGVPAGVREELREIFCESVDTVMECNEEFGDAGRGATREIARIFRECRDELGEQQREWEVELPNGGVAFPASDLPGFGFGNP